MKAVPIGEVHTSSEALAARERQVSFPVQAQQSWLWQIRWYTARTRRALPQFQTQVPHPLREDLAKLLAARRMGIPSIRVLLDILIGKHRLKRSSVQIQIKHI